MPRKKDRKRNGKEPERALQSCPEKLTPAQRLKCAGEEIAEALEWYQVRFVSEYRQALTLACNEDYKDERS